MAAPHERHEITTLSQDILCQGYGFSLDFPIKCRIQKWFWWLFRQTVVYCGKTKLTKRAILNTLMQCNPIQKWIMTRVIRSTYFLRLLAVGFSRIISSDCKEGKETTKTWQKRCMKSARFWLFWINISTVAFWLNLGFWLQFKPCSKDCRAMSY